MGGLFLGSHMTEFSLEAFTEPAKSAINLAAELAFDLNHPDYVNTGDLLYGLLAEPSGEAAELLLRHGVEPETVRDKVLEYTLKPRVAPIYGTRMNPELQQVLANAGRLGLHKVTTSHLLISIYDLCDPHFSRLSMGGQILRELNVPREALLHAI
jgi:ATP-dependent Clp protease ATP-binding subunit ClpA